MKYITIGREFGSGGREIGKLVAEKLGIPYYDRELLTLASQKAGVSEGYLETLDERGTAGFFQALLQTNSYGGVASYINIPMNDRLYLLQGEIIKELAKKGDCVFIGRCADSILEGTKCLKTFIHAPIEYRLARVSAREGISVEDAYKKVLKIDRKRKSYYNHYSDKKWGLAKNYDITLDSKCLSKETIADIIIKAFESL